MVKGSNYLEILSETKYIVIDKTGTQTQGAYGKEPDRIRVGNIH